MSHLDEISELFNEMNPKTFFSIFGLEKPSTNYSQWSASLKSFVLKDLSTIIGNSLADLDAPTGTSKEIILNKVKKLSEKPRYIEGIF
jgi:hypothetical protein